MQRSRGAFPRAKTGKGGRSRIRLATAEIREWVLSFSIHSLNSGIDYFYFDNVPTSFINIEELFMMS